MSHVTHVQDWLECVALPLIFFVEAGMAPHVAPPVPNRNALENMKRVDLQRLCKVLGDAAC